MKPAIRVENLSKLYRIGVGGRGPYRTLRETIMDTVAGPWRRLRSLGQSPSRNGQADEHWALKDVSLDVQPGEVVGIIGRNGAGKSTLLKILSRITEPTSGRATLHGRVGSLLEVGTGFHPELTGRENIYLNGSILGMSRREIERKFDEIVAFSEIEKFLDTPVKRYSSGMYVRLAFAVAANLEPEILIVDEVLAVGDMAFQKKCLGKMNDVSRSGRTVLFVSHNMAAIVNLCRQVIVLEHGRVVYVGDTKEGVDRYTHRFSKSEGGELPLSGHSRRQPGCTPIVRGIRFRNHAGAVTDTIGCGEDLTIELEIDAGLLNTEANFGVEVDDSLGRRMFTVATYFSPTGPVSLQGLRRVICRLNEVPLAPGRYTVSVHVKPLYQPFLDCVEHAAGFDVVATDIYECGRMPEAEKGHYVMRSDWNAEYEGP